MNLIPIQIVWLTIAISIITVVAFCLLVASLAYKEGFSEGYRKGAGFVRRKYNERV